MDQQAFRQLLATPRADGGQQNSSSASSSSSPFRPRQFGKTQRRGGQGSSEASAPLLPRKVGGSSSKSDPTSSSPAVKEPIINSSTGEAYVDRAEARRLGREDDTDNAESEDQNDSGIVKGLDFALLAKQKARLNGSGSLNDDDDDLEQAYGSSSKPEEKEKNREDEKREKAMPSKFKPIGSKSQDSGTIEEEAPEYIWRDGKRMRKKKKNKVAPQLVEKDPKEIEAQKNSKAALKPGRTVTKPEQRAKEEERSKPERLEIPAQNVTMPNGGRESSAVPSSKADEMAEGLKADSAAQSTAPSKESREAEEESSGDEGSDIFADAGRWQGLEGSDDEEGEDGEGTAAGMPAVVNRSAAPSGRRDWFGDGREDSKAQEADEVSVKLPSGLENIVGDAKEAQLSEAKRDADSSSGSEASDGEDGQEAAAKPQRLEGFSDSILGREGVRYMLDKKDDDGPDRKRKRKRSKKGKGGYGSD